MKKEMSMLRYEFGNGCKKKNTVLKKLNSLICNFKQMRAQSDNKEDIN